MGRNGKIVIALLAVAAAVIGGTFYYAGTISAAQTAEAVGTVVRAEREVKRGDDDTIVILSYQAGGVETQGRDRVGGVRMHEYPAGRQLPVCYDPANPSSVRIADGPCG
jgi:hypothetical protein